MTLDRPFRDEDRKELIGRVEALSDDEERRRFFEANPSLLATDLLDPLCAEISELLRVDLDRAERLAATAWWMAGRLEDGRSRGRVRRTLANLAHQRWDYEAAGRLYDAAQEEFDRLGDRREDAITRSSALQNLIYLGEYDKAHRWYLAARQVFEELDDRLRLARLEMNYANLLHRQDRWDEAMRRYESALGVFRELDEAPDAAIALRNMAICCINRHDYARALECYEQAKEVCEARGWELLALENDYNIAYLYYQRGEYAEAVQRFQVTRRRCEELGDERHKALCDLDQAEIFLELNLVEEAAQLAQWAYASFDRIGMRYEAAKALTNLAIAVSRQGKVFLALETLTKAREIFVSESNRVWPALLDLYQGMILDSEGRSFDAGSLASRALEVFLEERLPSKAAMCETLLARLALEEGDLQTARRRCRSALDRLQPLGSASLEYQVHYVLGQVEESLGDRDAALAAYRRAHECLDRLRSHIQAEELKISVLEDKLEVYESLVSMCLRGSEGERDVESAFAFIEKSKSRSLADLMAFRAHSLPAKSSTRSNLVEQIRGLREQLNWYYRQIDLGQMRRDETTRKRLAELREKSHEQEQRLLRTLRELGSTDREFTSLQDAATVDLASFRARLPAGTTLIEYFFARSAVYACVVGASRFEIVPLTVVSRVRELYRLLQFQLSKFLLGRDYVSEFGEMIGEATKTHLSALHEELIAPLEPFLEGEELVIVPHDVLFYVPFHALFDGHRFLIDRFAISYAPSATVFDLCLEKQASPTKGSLVMGIGHETVPAVLDEVRSAAAALPGSELLLDPHATLQNLRRRGERRAFVHLATHGHFRQDSPMFSSLQLSDGRLSLFDLYGLSLQSHVVTLTGCGTGLGVVVGADEIVGLTRGLLYAGAESVLTTLWDVREASTSELLQGFYRRVAAGLGRAEALRQAVRALRESHPHPYFWAPFVLFGRPD